MKKVNVINTVNNKTFSANFDSGQEMNEWITNCKNCDAWGKSAYDEITKDENGVETVIHHDDEYTIEIVDITDQVNREKDLQEKKARGKVLKECCEDVLNYVTGYNDSRELTREQVDGMQYTFSTIFTYLLANRAPSAKELIELVEVDGTVITQELKDNCLFIFGQHGI